MATLSKKLRDEGWVTQEELDRQLFAKPGFKEAYDALELEFAIINALLDARVKKGLTQAKLAKKIGTQQSAIARFESGRANPTLAFVQKLTDALDLKLTVVPRHAK